MSAPVHRYQKVRGRPRMRSQGVTSRRARASYCWVSRRLARRLRRNSDTIGVNSAIAAIPNSRKVTSTPSDDEFGLYPHFTARIFPRRFIDSSYLQTFLRFVESNWQDVSQQSLSELHGNPQDVPD